MRPSSIRLFDGRSLGRKSPAITDADWSGSRGENRNQVNHFAGRTGTRLTISGENRNQVNHFAATEALAAGRLAVVEPGSGSAAQL